MSKVKTTERGWPGHFIGGDRCIFHRNTLVEYENEKIIVSTVGRWRNSNDKIETIGRNRYFETMAFKSREDKFDDIDVGEPVHLEGKVSIDHKRPEADIEANKMHEARVEEVKELIQEV